MYIERLLNGFIKGYKLSWIKKYTMAEMSFIFFTALYPFVFILGLEIFYIINFVLMISVFLSMYNNEIFYKNEWSLLYKCILICSGVVQVNGILFFLLILIGLDDSNIFLLIIMLVGILAYISLVIVVVMYWINIIFYIGLKIVFPNENEEIIENRSFTFREISSFMSLQNQVAYFILSIVHSLIYLTVVAFVFGCIAHFNNEKTNNEVIKKLEVWIVNSDLISIGNTLGLISIILTLLTITVPFQTKIINKAYERYIGESKS